ncbi:transposase [Natronogracilivirgula saccharolytica]|uniref:Transposase n=2 Tax=Natronogracilivirga saccharolytica TaxID=2812953 RepID=A0A8J7SBD6_9BACT|nr:transposase [Natronogracilivirga saccharolytica]
MVRKITDAPILFTADSGNDSTDNVEMLREQPNTDFILKHNLRKQDPAEWLALAKEQTGEKKHEEVDIGTRAWYGEEKVALPGQDDVPEDKKVKQRVVFRAIWRFARPDGVTAQYVTDPQITIDAYWNSLDWIPQHIKAFYQQSGTSEQYHSELKSDMDLEHLPSGKMAANQQVLDLAMIAYNLLRLLGQQMLETGLVPGRKARSHRLRLRTVMQNLMYMAGRLVRHARRNILHIINGHGWAMPVMALARSPD